ncbi:MAG TPA: DHHA2 domain-containing protein [Spirochaetia bacterium]|nr:DHHA2 domain-containing protein [Spirochaetia bacterium]
MAKEAKPLIVIGHKNPDTDSICAAIAYARLSSEVLKEPASPYRAGNVNLQTQFVLKRFEVESPPLATDVRSRIDDIMIPKSQLITLHERETLERACDLLTNHHFSFLPVVDAAGRSLGKVTALRLVGVLRKLAAACREEGEPLGERERNVLAGTIGDLVDRQSLSFKPSDVVKDVQREIGKSNEGGFLIQDADGMLKGVITRINFLEDSRLRVVMVDHNEVAQAVDGIEEADVVQVIDHHRLGARTTTTPITFINRVVGSTCTIISDLYRNNGAVPPKKDAGLMLSALLSDTLVLRSPTTTGLDRDVARWLGGLAGVDVERYGTEMIAAGSALEGVDPRKIITQDQKVYTEAGRKFSLSQVETVSFDPVLALKEPLAAELEKLIQAEGLSFACLMITDLTRETSLLLCRGEARVLGAIEYPRREEKLFEMKDVLSRKKQLLPYFANLLKAI